MIGDFVCLGLFLRCRALSGLYNVLTFGVFVTERRGSHVTEAQGSLAAAVHKQVAVMRVELCGRYHLRQILHVGGFDVYDI